MHFPNERGKYKGDKSSGLEQKITRTSVTTSSNRKMPTTHVSAGSGLELQGIADILAKSRKVVVVTGAGISTNSGIPVCGVEWPNDGLCSNMFTNA